MSETAIEEHRQVRIGQSQLADAMVQLYESCNRITVDELETAIVDAGLFLAKVELLSEAFHVTEELQRVPITLLGVSGIKLLAVKRIGARDG